MQEDITASGNISKGWRYCGANEYEHVVFVGDQADRVILRKGTGNYHWYATSDRHLTPWMDLYELDGAVGVFQEVEDNLHAENIRLALPSTA